MRSSLIRPSFWLLRSLRSLLGPAALLVGLLILGRPADAVAQTCSATDAAVKDIAGTKVVAGDHNDIVDDCTTLLGLKDTLRGTVSLNWATTLAMTAWDGIKTDDRGEISGDPPRVTKLRPAGNEKTLTGTIPSTLGNLTGLTNLWLGSNQLTGTIPPELGNLTRLSQLDLRNNRLTGSIPTQLGNLTGMKYLYLSENQLTGTIPDLSKLTGLESLYLGNNNFTSGGIPAWVTKLTRLGHLHLHNTNRTGALPDLSALTGLESLKLPNNSLTAPSSWTWLASLDDLWRLDLSHNSLSGTVPTQLGSLTDLSHLYINNNQLTGTIPDLSKLTRLRYLKLGNNSFTSGGIPAWVTQLTNLHHLHLNNANRTGTIPDLSALTNLGSLDLSHNSLSGTIPTSLGSLSLYEFYATSNTTLCLPQSLKSWHTGGTKDVLLLCLPNADMTFRQRSAISAVTVEMSGGSYSLKSGYPKPALPSGLSFNSTTNTLSGTPDTAQEKTAYTFEFHNSQKTSEFVRLVLNITVEANAVPAFGNHTIADQKYTTGQSVSYNFPQASGGDAPLTYTLSPALPAGLTFNGTVRPPTLSGTPSAPAPSTAYTYTVTDKDGDTAPLSFSLTVVAGSTGSTGGTGGGGGAGAAGDQHGNTPAAATRVAVGSSIPGQINAPIDQDYFAIAVPQAGLLVVETSGSTDTQGSLATPDGQVLAQADSGGAQQNFQVRQRVAAGDYLVAVSGTEPGSYRLEVDLLVGFVDNPQPASAQSGIGVLSGWVCEAETVEVELNGELQEAAYGTERTDTHRDCGDTNNGFGLLYNWNKLGDGAHTVRVLVDGIVFATLPVTVTTLGLDEEFPTGLTGETTLEDFPADGESLRLVWQEAQQNFALAEGPVTQRGTTRDWTWAVLENPAPGSYQSGIRVISGWVCEAEEVVVEIDGTQRLEAAYGTARPDTEERCGDTNNGFGVLWNWNKLADGAHTMRLVVDGEEWATAAFVRTL